MQSGLVLSGQDAIIAARAAISAVREDDERKTPLLLSLGRQGRRSPNLLLSLQSVRLGQPAHRNAHHWLIPWHCMRVEILETVELLAAPWASPAIFVVLRHQHFPHATRRIMGPHIVC
jgi:hypothetical protein